jgi:hypothetical protein
MEVESSRSRMTIMSKAGAMSSLIGMSKASGQTIPYSQGHACTCRRTTFWHFDEK